MSDTGRKALRGAGIALGAAAAVAAGACALTAPRKGDAKLDARWAEIARHRYAHRGLYGEGIPENSLAAFRHARELGFGVELDVHLTLDGKLAVIHDSNLMRVTGRPGTVEELTIDELGEYRLLDPLGNVTDEAVPKLGEVLALFELGGDDPAPAPLIVEIKPTSTNYELLCLRTMACLDSYDVRYCVESFDPRVVAWLRQNRPDVVRGQLAEDFVKRPPMGQPLGLSIAGTYLLGNAASRPDFIAYRYEDAGKNPAVRLACDVLGGHFVAWTLRSEKELLDTEARGGVGIFEGFIPGPASTRA